MSSSDGLTMYIDAMDRATKPKHAYQFIRRISPTTDEVMYSIEWPAYVPYNRKLSELNTAIDDLIRTHGAYVKFTVEIDDVALKNIKSRTELKYNVERYDGYLLLSRRSFL